MNLRLGITPKLALILTAFVGFLLLGFGLPSTYQGFHALEEAAKTELFSTSGEKVLSIENWLIDREAHIIGLGHSHELARLVDDLGMVTPGSTREKILRDDLTRRLWEWTVTSPDYRSLMIIDPQTGIVVSSTNPDRIGQSKADQAFFTQGLLKTYVQSLGDHLSPTTGVMAISTPLLSVDGDIVGVLAAEVGVETLWAIVNAQSTYHASVDAYLVNPAHALVTLPRDVTLEAANQQIIDTPAANLCLQGKSGVMTTQDFRGQPSITAYHWMPAQQVCMIVEERRSEAVAPLRGYAQTITIAGGLALALTFTLAYFIANRVTRPVLALQQGVERISNGELDFRLPARSSDELGVLEREFNHMAQRLADKEVQLAGYANELEEKVLERTQELRASEAEMRALIAAMTDVILVFDSEGTYLKVPNARQENLVLPAEEIVGKRLHEVFPARQADRNLAVIREALQIQGPVTTEYSVFAHGSLHWMSATASPINNREVVWVARDITSLKKVEEALRDNRRSLTTLLSNLPGMAYRCLYDANWTMEFVSDGCLALTGCPPEALLFNTQLSYGDLILEEDRTRVYTTIEQAVTEKRPFQIIYRIRTPQGQVKWVWEQGQAIYSSAGDVEALEGFVHDITEREEARAELEKNERKFRSLIEQSSDGIVLTNRVGQIIEWNQAQESITGWPREKVLGKTIWEIQRDLALPERRTPESAALIEKTNREILAKGAEHLPNRLMDKTIIRPDGERRLLQTAVFTIPSDGGHLIGSIARDLTQQRIAEEALRKSEDRYRKLVENAPDIIFTCNRSGEITSLNPAFETVTGFSREEWLGKPLYALLRPEDRAQIEKAVHELADQLNPWVLNLSIATRDGRYALVEMTVTSLLENDQEISIMGVARDISERDRRERELEALLRLSGRLRAASSRDQMLSVILQEVGELFQADSTFVTIRDLDTEEIEVEMGWGISAWLTKKRIRMNDSLSGRVISTGKPVLVKQQEYDQVSAYGHLLPPVEFLLGIPLVTEDHTVGVLWMGRNIPPSGNDRRLLSAMAEIAASSIHRGDLHEHMQRSLRRLSALNMIDRAINSSLDLRVTLNVFLSQVTTQLQVDAVDILLLNTHTNQLEYTAGRGFRGKAIESLQLSLGDEYAGQVALNRQPISIPDLAADEGSFAKFGLIRDEDFASYFCMPLLAKGHLKGVLEVFHRAPMNPDQEWMSFLESLAEQATIAIDNAQLFDDMQRSNVDLALAYEATIEGWSHALDLRDKETEGHTQRAVELTLQLAQLLGVKEENLLHIRRGALLHDIGKMGVSDAVLLKPGPLTEEERAQMRKHPQYALELLSPIGYLRPAIDIPYAHHEKWDGTGYPRGLKGEEIPFAARIFAVVDVWDALISDRPYRKAWSKSEALKYIREQSGAHFDPQVVNAFLTLIAQ